MTKTYTPELYTFVSECTEQTVLALEHLLDSRHMEHHRVTSKRTDAPRGTITVEYKASIYENIALEKPFDEIFG